MRRRGALRSLAKTFTWRVVATGDTFLLGWLVTGSLHWAGTIAGLEVATKMVLYFSHERLWALVGRRRYRRRDPIQ